MSHESNPTLLAQYKASVQHIRTLALRVPTKSGRPSRGPRYLGVGVCTDEPGTQYGIISSKGGKGRKWACNTCFGFMEPVWSDGPLPDVEDAREEWAEWAAKESNKANGEYAKRRKMMGYDL